MNVGPSLGETTRCLLGLRFLIFVRQLSHRGLLGTLVSAALAIALSAGLGLGSYLLFAAVPAITSHPIWMHFALSLFCFLLALFWVLWPVLSAQVDEAYELGRFFVYPVRPTRLYLIQTIAGLLEPSVLFFYPALLGAGLGLAHSLQPGWTATVLLMLAFTFMVVSFGRCLQNMFLNLMTSRRSGEYLTGGLLLFLGLSAFIPPVDASWLFAKFGGFGSAPEDLLTLHRTARALGQTPPGWLAEGLAAAAEGRGTEVANRALAMLSTGIIAWVLGLIFLKRFYRGGRGLRLLPARKRATIRKRPRARLFRLPFVSDPVSAIFDKELKTQLANPKARLLFAVPFFLLILLKIVGAWQLFAYLWGDAWAAILLALLNTYLLSVLAGQFLGNGFGYDGPGIYQTYLAPVRLHSWLAGRNLAMGLLAIFQAAVLTIFLFLLAPGAQATGLALPLLSFPFGLLVMLAIGNLLSARYPRRFHLSLSRRDRPVGASFLLVLLALGLCTLITLAFTTLAAGNGAALWAALSVLPLLGLLVYAWVFPIAVRWTGRHRERIIEAVAREH